MLSFFGSWFSSAIENKVKKNRVSPDDGIAYIYEKLFYRTALVMLVIGFFALSIGLYLGIKEKEWLVVVVDILTYTAVIFMYLSNRISTKQKFNLLLVIIYLLAIVLIVELGPYGAGIIWLIAFSVFASVFGGLKLALRTVLINTVTLVLLGMSARINLFNISYYQNLDFIHWVSFAANMLLINILSAFLIAYFFEALKNSLQKEYHLKEQLKRKSERLVEAKIKAEESDRLKSSFLANVSHEFRTPMNAIVGFTEIMLYTETNEEQRKKYLYYIQKSSEQLMHLINNTLEYSKIEMGLIHLNIVEVNIFELLHNLYEQFETKCPEGVSFNFKIPEEIAVKTISTDKEKLHKVFFNLISNSFKFTSKGSVQFGQIESEHKDFVKFFVRDTGIGIRKEKQKDIFTRFYKDDEFKDGTGLGLSICNKLIAHMRGRMWLESELDKGTIFYFILPKKLVVKSDF